MTRNRKTPSDHAEPQTHGRLTPRTSEDYDNLTHGRASEDDRDDDQNDCGEYEYDDLHDADNDDRDNPRGPDYDDEDDGQAPARPKPAKKAKENTDEDDEADAGEDDDEADAGDADNDEADASKDDDEEADAGNDDDEAADAGADDDEDVDASEDEDEDEDAGEDDDDDEDADAGDDDEDEADAGDADEDEVDAGDADEDEVDAGDADEDEADAGGDDAARNDNDDGADEDDHTADSARRMPATGACVERFDHFLDKQKARRERGHVRGMVGAATGIPQLDAATNGLQQVTIIGGQTQTGKTSLAVKICIHALRQDPQLGVVYYLLDDFTEDNFFELMICSQAQVDLRKFQEGNLSKTEDQRIQHAIDSLRKDVIPRLRIVPGVENGNDDGLNAGVISHACSQFNAQLGLSHSLVVLDMLEDMPLPCNSAYEETVAEARRAHADPSRWRREQIHTLRTICKIQVLVLAKLRKSHGHEPTSEDVLGDVELTYLAHQILLLVRDPVGDPGAEKLGMTLRVVKARNGTTTEIPVWFFHTQNRFEEVADRKAGKTKNTPPRGKTPADNNAKKPPKINPLAGLP